MIELFVLIFGISIILIIIYFNQNKYPNHDTRIHTDTNIHKPTTEGFSNYYLKGCPSGYSSFYNTDGDVICCDGDVIANKCLGDRQCTLNGKGTADMPNCVTAILNEYETKGKTQCSSSLPNYFENKETKMKGCTNGMLNDTLDGPKHASQNVCKIYSTLEENISTKDSCYNYKLLDEVECFGANCKKEIVQASSTSPILIGISFTDGTGMHRVAYTRNSMENYLNNTNPKWREEGLDLTKNINVAEVAKAYYVDKTLSQSEVQF
jgi:hypothetical protein